MLNKAIKILIGVALVALGIYLIVIWWGDVLALIRGGLGMGLILAGLIFFAILD
ncbi:hypothetical protein HZC35_05000 [Candidatus Saganbacteria bacterium]|nr:hypothetical protein [Candidatus Saganbacteria bacterium]